MKKILAIAFFLSFTIFGVSQALAADSQDHPDLIQFRGFVFEKISLCKALLYTQRCERDIIDKISNLATAFISLYGQENLQKFYDKHVAEARRQNFSPDAMKDVESATLAALCDTSLNLQEDFRHGFMIDGNFLIMFVELLFPTIEVGAVDLCESDNNL